MKGDSNRLPGVWAAKCGMFRTCDDIDQAKAKHDPVLIANARTSMDDYRLALSLALGKSCDRNGYYRIDTLEVAGG